MFQAAALMRGLTRFLNWPSSWQSSKYAVTFISSIKPLRYESSSISHLSFYFINICWSNRVSIGCLFSCLQVILVAFLFYFSAPGIFRTKFNISARDPVFFWKNNRNKALWTKSKAYGLGIKVAFPSVRDCKIRNFVWETHFNLTEFHNILAILTEM